MKQAKNDWQLEKARLVEVGMLSGGSSGLAWWSIREMQKGRAGLRPVTTKIIKSQIGMRVLARKKYFSIGSIIFMVRGAPCCG